MSLAKPSSIPFLDFFYFSHLNFRFLNLSKNLKIRNLAI
ncbi:hypothetical protein CKA32_005781 [Geitlerinema sp. FC II]|nr:hypothetical protein CKA32_005781 [Geitlerinema sp. FC II]